ncbi:MAG: hypothetical protein AB1414_21130 [bacterium]
MRKIEESREQDNPQVLAQKLHGRRIDLLERVGVPNGWVINGRIPQEIWTHIKTFAIPLTPGGLNPFKRREAEKQLAKVRRKYGADAFMLMVPDDESFEGWSARPVLPTDFGRDPNQVLDEGSEASSKGDFLLADMKRCAFMAMTGWVDTK